MTRIQIYVYRVIIRMQMQSLTIKERIKVVCFFFPSGVKVQMYFCSFKCNELDECDNHCVTHHSDKQVTIRTFVLDTVSGLILVIRV